MHVIHSEKKSYGYQMNQGIAHATGEYIGIVETDDLIQEDMFAFLYDEAIQENADYVKGISEGFYQGLGDSHGDFRLYLIITWRINVLLFQKSHQNYLYMIISYGMEYIVVNLCKQSYLTKQQALLFRI